MTEIASELVHKIESLTDEDCRQAMVYVEFLSLSRKQAAKATLHRIQDLFTDDTGWPTEAEMLKDMAAFRQERLSQCAY